ncbi:hypothetical protein [Levilactobacillus mulengensis]|uniref:hypothetical protein n=1 Tax=Levilactobacillus mulengensis TaxID=2486025 RepID=UPI000F78AEBC|nr:hypothetical protein [Levilactobacillus mulengensis]
MKMFKTEDESQKYQETCDLGNAELDWPLDNAKRDLVVNFFVAQHAYQAISKQIEKTFHVSLAFYQQHHRFYVDISDLTHYRMDFLSTTGRFLREAVDATYQLEIWDRESHRKHAYSGEELIRMDCEDLKKGTVVETLTYGRLDCRVRRTFSLQNGHLFWDKEQFYVAGKPVELIDGLMILQQRLTEETVWFSKGLFRIRDFT